MGSTAFAGSAVTEGPNPMEHLCQELAARGLHDARCKGLETPAIHKGGLGDPLEALCDYQARQGIVDLRCHQR